MILSANPKEQLKGSAIPSMQVPIVKSGIFHVLIVVAATIGIPFAKKEPLLISPPISVEIVDVSELTTTPKIKPPAKPKEEDKPPEPQQKKESSPQMTADTPPDLSKPTPPDIEETIDETPDVPPPEPLKRKPIKKPDPPKPKPEVTKKAKPKPKQDDFQSLLKNIIPDDVPKDDGQEKLDPDSEPDNGQIARLADQLSISEQDALRRQLAGCWYVQAGAKYAEDLVVEIRVQMNRDRTVNRASILDRGRYNQDTHYRAAADAALRALRNPRCSPLQLPPEKYDQWETVLIRFDPRDML